MAATGSGAATPDLEDTFVEPRTRPRRRAQPIDAVPDRIDHFVILRRLGRGGMGEVFAAYDERLDRRVAVKLLRSGLGSRRGGEQANRRLIREAQALARLSHPNVVQVYEAGEHDGRVFVAMEFIEGATLRRWIPTLTDEPRRWRAILARCCEAGRGLAAAHDAGMIHRDFKPDNLVARPD